jgi:DNA-binding transcriptional LysR family regulator
MIRHDGDAGRAARALKINQPSMSKRLASLQHAGKILRRPWLKREGKAWLLTDEGRRTLPVVQEMLDRYRNLTGFTNGQDSTPHSELRFACGQTAAAVLVRRALTAFRRKHPAAQIRVSCMRAPQRIIGVASGAIDMALVDRDDEEIRGLARGVPLKIETIARIGYCLVCAKDSPWAASFARLSKRDPLPLKTLADFPLIVPEPDSHTRQLLDPVLHSQPWGRRVAYQVEVGGWLAILEYVRSGHGVGLVSQLAIDATAARSLHVRTLAGSPLRPQVLQLVVREAPNQEHSSPSAHLAEAWRACLADAVN